MKKMLLFTIVLLTCSHTYSQEGQIHFTMGYNISFPKLDPVNDIINDYNQSRKNNLDQELEQIKNTDGFAISLGVGQGFFFDLTWVGRNKDRSAYGTFSGLDVQRDLKLRMNSFNIGMGGVINKVGVIGGSFDIGKVKAFTRVEERDMIDDEDWEELVNELSLGLTVFGQFGIGAGKGLGLFIRPYFQFHVWEIPFSNVYTIHDQNANTALLEGYSIRPNGFGVMITTGFYNYTR